MVKEYFSRRSPVYPGVEGRIKLLNNVESAASKIRSLILVPFLFPIATVLNTV
jgi:hypothetical protein